MYASLIDEGTRPEHQLVEVFQLVFVAPVQRYEDTVVVTILDEETAVGHRLALATCVAVTVVLPALANPDVVKLPEPDAMVSEAVELPELAPDKV
jgi:hypothetical protein